MNYPSRGDVTEAVRTVYGEHGLGRFEQLGRYRSDASLPELVNRYQTAPSPEFTYFFRQGYSTLSRLAHYALLWKPKDTHVQVAQVGASGEETWSMATVFAERGMNYDIAAYDVNPAVLARAHGPFDRDPEERRLSLNRLIGLAGRWVDGHAISKHFDETPRGVVPRDALRQRASFSQHDIVASPLPGSTSDVVSVHNVLWHYPLETRNHIMANIITGLNEEGIFFYEGRTRSSRQAPGYYEWTYGLREYGLLPPSYDHENILWYQPHHAEREFTRSQAVVEALATLAVFSEERALSQ